MKYILETFELDGGDHVAVVKLASDERVRGSGIASTEPLAFARALDVMRLAQLGEDAPTLRLVETPEHPADAWRAANPNPPALSFAPGGEPGWANLTLRQRIEQAIAEGVDVEVGYVDAKARRSERRVRPIRFTDGPGFKEKLMLIDRSADDLVKGFFVSGIDSVERA